MDSFDAAVFRTKKQLIKTLNRFYQAHVSQAGPGVLEFVMNTQKT